MIPLFKNYYDEHHLELVREVLSRGMYWANGPEIPRFEQAVADVAGRTYGVAFNSGTSALHSILIAIDVRDFEVIVPSFTFIATANSVLQAGGRVVFADIEEETLGLSPEDVRSKITAKTRVIMPVHYGGCSCRIDELKEIAEDNDLILIEDAAEALGAKYNNRTVGGFGDAAMFSFTPSKVISTGEGGVIVTDSAEHYEKLKLLRSHGRLEDEDYFSSARYMDYITMGYNYRMPSICAALGLAQLARLDEIIEKRRAVAGVYNERLAGNENITVLSEPENCYHIYQMYSIFINGGREMRDGLQAYLKDNDIITKVYFDPIHFTHYYRNELKYDIKIRTTEEISGKTLSLPIYPGLAESEQAFVVEKIEKYFDSQ